ncbi:MAG: aromatic ring-hydroxylating dioxygenase subunit alpha [Leptolyngbya sp. LCM1.Bin17]|nr:MAG: aromatic ring-hydroxylating dioxygenase subunit alpha [Leptolyngbya sp. LCM1.Bin17]
MSTAVTLPRDCTFSPSDWEALAPFWYPVAFSQEVTADKPLGVRLLDERLVLYRTQDGPLTAARDLCLHRGAPLSLGWVEDGQLVCAYHGDRYTTEGQCVCIPAAPEASIPKRLRLTTYPVQERYGLIWVRLVDNGPVSFPEFEAWDDPDYIRIIPNSVHLEAAAGRQVEGFLDVSHFAFVHKDSFGESDNPEVPDYPIAYTDGGFTADYVSSVSNLPHGYKHLSPPGFQWRRLFQVWLPFTVKLSVTFPEGKLHILNAACPVSARKTRVFSPLCRNFDKDAPLEDTLAFNHQVFGEDKAIVEELWPEDLPINLADEVHIAGDKSSIAYRKLLAKLGLGRSFTA